ncbi:MAG: FMN-binding protein, partial [Planctomycetota bacterium]|nr:FMN-binding protein [Planctomycetota bacterium]
MTNSVRGLQAFRLSAAVAIAWLVHDAGWDVDAAAKDRRRALDLARQALPAETELAWQEQALVARAPDGQLTATGLCTQPVAEQVIGYSGTTDVLLLFGARDGRIGHVELVRSGDTKDHVRAVVEHEGLLPGYLGLTANEAAARRPDAVSGATLTSYAIIESIALRLGGARPALRFPEPVTLVEVRDELPAATAVEEDPARPQSGTVYENGLRLAEFLCTGAIAEGILGYQGPSDVLLLFGLDERLERGVLRGTYDNQPYVRDVAIDAAFWRQFVGKTRIEIAAMDPRGIDGVSGATMTSHAVGRGVVAALRASEWSGLSERQSLSPVGWGSVVVVLLLTLGALTGGHRWPVWRWGARLVAIGWLGLVAGDLLSQALLVGWLQGAIPWQTAPGLVLLVGAALLVPAATGRPVYCEHLCPQ